jgi:hypothetical protein
MGTKTIKPTKTKTKVKAKVKAPAKVVKAVKAKVLKADIISKVATIDVTSVRKQLQSIGDMTATLYNETNDLKAAQTALQAYNGAISAAKAQLIYKKMTGEPGQIKFFED